jgi:hypothetical protein
MIFRAVFWIGLVSLLMPHEPNLGFGRPQVGASPTNVSERLDGSGRSSWLLESFKSVATRSLARVKADIEESQRAPNARALKVSP